MTRGIVIYAIGHRNYYFMAENLAASLRVNGCRDAGIKVCALSDQPGKFRYSDLFDDIIMIPRDKFMEEDKVVFNNVTIQIYDLSPYDITVKLDADMIWLGGRPVDHLFNQLKDLDIAFINTGHGWNEKKSPWASEGDIKRAYQFTDQKLYRIYGEFLYFKKTIRSRYYFEKAKDIYFNPKVKCQEFSNGNMTDELAFQIACMDTGIYPHEDNYTPIYNHFLEIKELIRTYPYQLPANFFAYSIGGNSSNSFQKANYNTLAKHYFKKLDLERPYMAQSKSTFLKERVKI